jgi:hypothetical protein
MEIYQLEALAAVEVTGPVVVVVLVDLRRRQPVQLAGGLVERAALFLQLQQQPLQAAAWEGLPMILVTTALTQPLILLVEMAAVAVAPVQLPLVQAAMVVIPVVAVVVVAQVLVWTPVLAATAAMATSES